MSSTNHEYRTSFDDNFTNKSDSTTSYLVNRLGQNETLMDYNVSGELTSSPFGPKRDSLAVVIPITIIYVIIFIGGIVGNISTCLVVARNKKMHTATNYYLFSLAISDLLLLFTGLPQEVYSIWSRYPYIFGHTFCIIRGLCSETSANATVLTIMTFTVERYLAICHPFFSHTISKLSRAVKAIVIIWIVSFALAIPQAMQFGVQNFIENDPESEMCQILYPLMKYSFEVSTLVFFVAPMTLITVLYILIGLKLRNSSFVRRNSSENEEGRMMNTNSKKVGISSQRQGKSTRKVIKMLVAVVIAFFLCWAPFHIQRLYTTYVSKFPENFNRDTLLKVYTIITYLSGIFYYISTAINPLLYNIFSLKFRDAFKETFTSCFKTKNLNCQSMKNSYYVISRKRQGTILSTVEIRQPGKLAKKSSCEFSSLTDIKSFPNRSLRL
ncbi:pyrokinin-1 receptor-like [Agrilus planipennis]|uniref:Pyrokinin-1 receptor-like n=1 Tax=Agrilus planipennis TaxID=224129 RepID=A0A1W4WS47_AGRPL|nr:pyrokinin-1 receptor-like [Agrilus planipennis]